LILNIKSGPFLERVRSLGIEPAEIRLEATAFGRLRFILQLAHYLREGRFDILQSYNDISMFYAGIAAKLAKRPVLVCGQRHTMEYGGWSKLKLISWTYKYLARYIMVNSHATAQMVLEQCRVPLDKIRVVYNGVELRSPRSPEKTVQKRAALGLPPHLTTIGLVARLIPLKQVDIFIQVAAKLKDLPVQFVVVGEGEMMDDLQRQVQAGGLSDRFWFVGFQASPIDWMEAFDMGVICSTTEGLPAVVMEYMAAGVPIVSFDLGGISEIVIENQTGFVLPAGDNDAMAGALRKLVLNVELRRCLGTNGQAFVENNCSLKQEASLYANAYRDCWRD
jgi:glycosyltransferase involved in cell wall biosynthesis